MSTKIEARSWKANPIKRVLMYVGITFAITWSVWIVAGLALGAFDGGLNSNPAMIGVISIGMFFPAIGALISNTILGKSHRVDLCLRPKIKGNVKRYLLAWFMPAVVSVLGVCVFFLVFPAWFDPSASLFAQAAAPAVESGEIPADAIGALLGAQVAFAILLAPFINMIPAVGEEIGWRGFMYPELAKALGAKKGVLVAGLIWGLWHAPATVMGHNYGMGYFGYPVTGILTMCVFCTSVGICLAWLRERTQSVWPCALCHGAINAIASVGVYFCTVGATLFGPSPAGLVGGIPLMALAVLCWRSLPSGCGSRVSDAASIGR